ncbi:glycosyltransferase family 4 protein [Mycolicibacterium grossiae]|uniref:glycosyltransferase family 4 protein n=1 Tax=Mycolicibacterium grossiae TaxID=1552759 RepID=UPI0009F17FBF|nr:glycosyltransferase family 4 protein [Mycolicibacterium grossiae]QEM45236.1 glycosyltransferase family 4 protein [Mycolicibacterium grossiae]
MFHVVLNRPSALGEKARGASAGENPRHSMHDLALRLRAQVHDGTNVTPARLDAVLARMTRTKPLWWSIARRLRREVRPGDVIFCTGEDVGLIVALLCGARSRRCHVAVMAHRVDTTKKRMALLAFRGRSRVALFTTVCSRQAEVLGTLVKNGGPRTICMWDQTDTLFFSPGPSTAAKSRPLIASVGLESRDYATLATATEDLDVDVRISGYSADTRVLAEAFPMTMPRNMERRFHTWRELVQLYRDADVVVVSLYPNAYAAGVQALMEALACGRPTVVTSTVGLRDYIEDPAVRCVRPGDADDMRAVLLEIIENPEESERLGQAAATLAAERHSCEAYVERLVTELRALSNHGEYPVTAR